MESVDIGILMRLSIRFETDRKCAKRGVNPNTPNNIFHCYMIQGVLQLFWSTVGVNG